MSLRRAALLLLSIAFATPGFGQAPQRSVAVTFDDLPANPAGTLSSALPVWRDMTAKLLAAFRTAEMPVIAFVNENKLDVAGETAADRAARIAVLGMWTDAGFELGNHTYSHPSLNRTLLEDFQNDVVRGEPVTRELLEARGKKLRYFRHPFLQVGLELEKRRAFEAFLKRRGYTIAPVTIDNDEWIYAAVYADALRKGEVARAARVAEDYLRYMMEVVEFIEGVSRTLVGREIAQVLLVHANQLNADHFGALAGRIKDRGYRFVTLDEALRDPAYQRPDSYVGAWGISWLHHWEITEGRERSPSPDPSDWITRAYQGLGR
jgi:peptidoglycan/xylan/chitin deacetylase (PgdA/CDA1 family)